MGWRPTGGAEEGPGSHTDSLIPCALSPAIGFIATCLPQRLWESVPGNREWGNQGQTGHDNSFFSARAASTTWVKTGRSVRPLWESGSGNEGMSWRRNEPGRLEGGPAGIIGIG